MDNFDFYSPTYFAFGQGRESECGMYVRKFGGTRVLVHFGGASAKKTGLLDRVTESLKKEELEYTLLGGVKPNPRSGLVYEGIGIARKWGADFILAVGGGSVIDSAKAIALGSVYEGDFWDFYEGKPVGKALPLGTVLTIAAAGSEGSGDTVVTREEGMLKRAAHGDCLRPKFSILNPELTQTLPAYQTACGITDIMAHVFERYLTNTHDVETTDRLCEAVLLAVTGEAPAAVKDPGDYQARANIMWAGMVAHNNVIGVGRSQDWISHTLEHELSALYDCAHGAGLAVIMPACMTYAIDHNVMRMAQAAVRIWGCQMDFEHPRNTALAGIAAFRQFLTGIGMPVTFEQLGAKEADIPILLDKLGIGDGTLEGYLTIDRAAAEAIYRLAL
jgi:alcohol dehydrogenase